MKTSGEALLKSDRGSERSTGSVPGLEPAPTKHTKLIAWVIQS